MASYLTEKEILLLDRISKKSALSQRDLSRATGISLGLINVLLKRLIKAGYLKASQLNKKKLQYLLTPEGLTEAAIRTYDKTIKIISNYKKLESDLSRLLKELHHSGYQYFSIYGDGELRDLTELAFQRSLEEAPVTLGGEHKKDPTAVVLNVSIKTINLPFKGDVVNVVERLNLSL